jgi:hypothetical protein
MTAKKKSTTKKASAPSVSESAKEAKSPKVEEISEVVPPKKVAPVPPSLPKARPVLVSFARWFAARSREKGWKPHWVAGMKAYANTAGRLPMEGWDKLFENY